MLSEHSLRGSWEIGKSTVCHTYTYSVYCIYIYVYRLIGFETANSKTFKATLRPKPFNLSILPSKRTETKSWNLGYRGGTFYSDQKPKTKDKY